VYWLSNDVRGGHHHGANSFIAPTVDVAKQYKLENTWYSAGGNHTSPTLLCHACGSSGDVVRAEKSSAFEDINQQLQQQQYLSASSRAVLRFQQAMLAASHVPLCEHCLRTATSAASTAVATTAALAASSSVAPLAVQPLVHTRRALAVSIDLSGFMECANEVDKLATISHACGTNDKLKLNAGLTADELRDIAMAAGANPEVIKTIFS
jgi:hypothetical protein